MRKSILAAGVAALAVLTTGAAIAQQQAPQPGQHRAARGDTDGDGRVSRAEFVDARVARLTAIDANRDGSITAEERQSGIDTRRNQRASHRFETLDKDGNGSISREEFTAQREARADRGERAGRHERRGHRAGFRGGRGHGEWGPRGEARGPLTIANVQTRLTTQFDRVDTNRDGFITAEERTAARQAMRTERQERRAARQASPSTAASE